MNSEQLGKIASDVEVTNISTHGIWLLVGEREFLLSYEDFPWFKEFRLGAFFKLNSLRPGTSIGRTWM